MLQQHEPRPTSRTTAPVAPVRRLNALGEDAMLHALAALQDGDTMPIQQLVLQREDAEEPEFCQPCRLYGPGPGVPLPGSGSDPGRRVQ